MKNISDHDLSQTNKVWCVFVGAQWGLDGDLMAGVLNDYRSNLCTDMTAQTPENLIYQGDELALCADPLAHFPGIKPVHPYAYPSTDLWRGYIGTWGIESDRLYLKALQRWRHDTDQLVVVGIEDLFPGFPDGVFAHWYTGELRCPRGALLKYVHGGFASTYEEDLFFWVQKGVVIEERIIRNGTAVPGVDAGYRINAWTTF